MLETLAAILVALFVGVVVFIATRPNLFRVERAIQINAAPERIYAMLDDFHAWAAWSPWEKRDPAMRRAFSGATTGMGAIYEWEGDRKVGKGRMEITGADPSTALRIKLDFFKPFVSHNQTLFTLAPGEGSTRVVWTMEGPNLLMSKLMSLFISMDNMIGKDFEKGLANLKAALDSASGA